MSKRKIILIGSIVLYGYGFLLSLLAFTAHVTGFLTFPIQTGQGIVISGIIASAIGFVGIVISLTYPE